jgi:capsule polysaccharide export protein KpsE/RkpR
MTTEKLDARIAELKTQLEQLVAQANQAIGELRGRIAEAESIRAMISAEPHE